MVHLSSSSRTDSRFSKTLFSIPASCALVDTRLDPLDAIRFNPGLGVS
jgi:hypothetical protein